MFTLTQVGQTRGDCTAPYKVNLDREYTIEEFVNAVIKNRTDERGSVMIGSRFSDAICEYHDGRITKPIPESLKTIKILSATADGGWTLIDYCLTLKTDEDVSSESKNDVSCKYYAWRKDNEARYIADPTLLENGAFKDTCTDEILIARVGKIVDHIYENPDANLLSTMMAFIQYLYEVHKLPAEDCELLGDIVIRGLHHQMKLTAESCIKAILGDNGDGATIIQFPKN